MIGIDCAYCAYCFDEALVIRQRLKEKHDEEVRAKEDVIAQKRKAIGAA